MPVETYSVYRRGMEALTAEEALMGMRISCAPHMKKESREKLFNKLNKIANPQEAIPMTAENLARILGG